MNKFWIPIISGILAFLFVFWCDSIIVNYILSLFPKSVGDWITLIKIGLWILAIMWTFGIALLFGWTVTIVIAYFIK